MAAYHIPGVAVGVLYQGEEYVRGYGVTNVDEPQPVDGDTLFRIASTTKTFTGTTVMRLVEQGKLDLNAPVRRYLPDFRVGRRGGRPRRSRCASASTTAPAGLGDDESDFGRGDDALARYVASMRRLPQLTPPGTQFAYSNTAVDTRRPRHRGGHRPDRTRRRCATCCSIRSSSTTRDSSPMSWRATRSPAVTAWSTDRAVFAPDLWYLPRNGHPDGGLISSARDQLRYARFHMGDGARRRRDAAAHAGLAAGDALRSGSGRHAGGRARRLRGELRSAAHRRRRAAWSMHGGSWAGQYSGFFFVPERDFAMTMLTNSDGGIALRPELFYDDWALQRFAGLHNPPAVPTRLPAARLAEYEGAIWTAVRSGRELGRDGAHVQATMGRCEASW